MLIEQQESDRGCVIFGAAIVEDELELLLRAHCLTNLKHIKQVVDPLFRGYAPLATFSAKTQVSFALGLIPEHVYKALNILRKLRNDFAHERTAVSFQSPRHRPTFLAFLDATALRDEQGQKMIDDSEAFLQESVPGMGKLTNFQLADRVAFCLGIVGLRGRIGIAREMLEQHGIAILRYAGKAQAAQEPEPPAAQPEAEPTQ